MDTVKLFIKEKQVNIVEMEREIGIPARTIRMDRELPNKYLPVIVEYLKKNHGFSELLAPNAAADVPGEKPVMQRVWNKHFIPKYADGIARYQDPENGLWKRIDVWQRSKHTNKETGEVTIKLNPEFEPITREVFEDKIGRYYVAKNGIKVYAFDKVSK